MLTKANSIQQQQQQQQHHQQSQQQQQKQQTQLTHSISPGERSNQQYQIQTMAGQRQQEALASLFRSLSNLATGNVHHLQQQQQQQQQIQPLDISNCQPSSLSQASSLDVAKAAGLAGSSNASSIASSIHSVMAAAVMQQQLVTEVISRQQQHHQQQQQPTPLMPAQRAQINSSHRPGPTAATLPPPPPSVFMSDQMLPVNYSFLEQQPQQHHHQQQQRVQQTGPGLEQDVQFPTIQTNLTNNNNNQHQNQRINYCTICNKELCNKYFMKTHMLKMHGISLEMEQQSASGGADNGDTQKSEGSPPDNEIRAAEETAGSGGDDDAACSPSERSPSHSANWSSQANVTQQQRQQHSTGAKGQKNQTPSGKQTTITGTGKQSNTIQAANSKTKSNSTTTAPKQATSVMNGFAGNSMGGVVCDICNKELCSKYFLKVHKQNTHGIMTDYQDAGQFVYPFVNPLAAGSAFMGPTMVGAPNGLPFPASAALCFQQQQQNQNSGQPSGNGQPYGHCESGPSGPKRARSLGAEKYHQQQSKRDANHSKSRAPTNGPSEQGAANETGGEGVEEKPLDPFFKFMVAHQRPAQIPLQPTFDQINQMSAMMCYGAMSPFGPAGLSPTMVVEMILRNQHLFNRNTNNQQQQHQKQANLNNKDKNNNSSSDSKQGKSGGTKAGSKEANNSRYFTHYTEACPMCDRRFKSIKWLKTHMMNDHKQEVGAYMQMMMQSMCPPKSQPAEHLQQQQQQFQLQPGPMSYSMSFNACAQLSAQPQHQKQTYQPQQPALAPAPIAQPQTPSIVPVPSLLCVNTSQQASLGQAGGNMTMNQDDQFSLLQGYLDQQRQVLQQQQQQQHQQYHRHSNQGVINLSSPETGQTRLAELNNLNAATRGILSSSSSSSSSSAKTSPRSMASILHENDHHHQVDQLDLSIKFNPDIQSCVLESGADFLQTHHSHNTEARISEFSDDEEDDCSTVSSSSRHENKPNEPEHFSETNASQSV